MHAKNNKKVLNSAQNQVYFLWCCSENYNFPESSSAKRQKNKRINKTSKKNKVFHNCEEVFLLFLTLETASTAEKQMFNVCAINGINFASVSNIIDEQCRGTFWLIICYRQHHHHAIFLVTWKMYAWKIFNSRQFSIFHQFTLKSSVDAVRVNWLWKTMNKSARRKKYQCERNFWGEIWIFHDFSSLEMVKKIGKWLQEVWIVEGFSANGFVNSIKNHSMT